MCLGGTSLSTDETDLLERRLVELHLKSFLQFPLLNSEPLLSLVLHRMYPTKQRVQVKQRRVHEDALEFSKGKEEWSGLA